MSTDDRALADDLARALNEAAGSLETIDRIGGRKDDLLATYMQIRGYAHNRASIARAALARYDAARKMEKGEDDGKD